jgi:hypothetical protein
MGAWRGAFGSTSDEIVYIVDTFAVVGGGALSPRDVKTDCLYPDTDGPTNTTWDLIAGASNVDAVDDPASAACDGNTSYIISNDSADVRHSFTDSGGSGITLTGDETVMAVMNWTATLITGIGLVNHLLLDSGTEANSTRVFTQTATDTYLWAYTGPYPRRLTNGTSRLGGSIPGSGWDVASVDALEFGVIRGAGASNNRRLSATYVEILYGLLDNEVDITGGTIFREYSEQEPTTTTNPDLDITSIAVAGNVITTERAHLLKVGDYVSITGSDSTPSINGHYVIATVATSTTFTLTGVTITGAGTVGVVSTRRAKTIAKAVL